MSCFLAIHNQAGDQLDRISDFSSIESVNRTSDIGYLSFTIPADHEALANIDNYSIIKFYRNIPFLSATFYLENIGIVLSRKYFYHEGLPYCSVFALHPNWLLNTRSIAYYGGTLNRSYFPTQNTESICKILVEYNATASATVANTRIRDGSNTVMPITIESNLSRGSIITVQCAYMNLFSTIQRLAYSSSFDFAMVNTSANSFEFCYYPSQLGTDRTTSLFFSTKLGNLANPIFVLDKRSEISALITGGIGEQDLRSVFLSYSPDYSSANDIEYFYNATYVKTTDGLPHAAAQYLTRHPYEKSFTLDLVQTYAYTYGYHYFLGDLVSIINPFTAQVIPAKINQVSISYALPSKTTPSPQESIIVKAAYGVPLSDDITNFILDYNPTETTDPRFINGGIF